MTKITVKALTRCTLTWNDKGEVQKDPTAYVIKDGKYVQAVKRRGVPAHTCT